MLGATLACCEVLKSRRWGIQVEGGGVYPKVIVPNQNNLRSFASRILKMNRDSRSALLHLKPSLQKVRETNWDLGPVVPTHMSKRWMQRPNLMSKTTELALDLLSYLLMFHLHWHSNCRRFDTSFGAELKPNGFSWLLPGPCLPHQSQARHLILQSFCLSIWDHGKHRFIPHENRLSPV